MEKMALILSFLLLFCQSQTASALRMSTQRISMKADIAILTSGNLRILDNPSLQYFNHNNVIPILYAPYALSMEETAAFEDLTQRLDSSKTVQIHSEDEMRQYIDGQKQKSEEVVIAYCTTSVEPVAGNSSPLLSFILTDSLYCLITKPDPPYLSNNIL